jgi:hypothetical protein
MYRYLLFSHNYTVQCFTFIGTYLPVGTGTSTLASYGTDSFGARMLTKTYRVFL